MSTIAPQPGGRSRAKAQGKHMGRPPAMTPVQQKEVTITRRRAQGATLQELARGVQCRRIHYPPPDSLCRMIAKSLPASWSDAIR
jgi:DNA invertase Pin-like site-specific DNA recombinase